MKLRNGHNNTCKNKSKGKGVSCETKGDQKKSKEVTQNIKS